jgi:hypothetical protein
MDPKKEKLKIVVLIDNRTASRELLKEELEITIIKDPVDLTPIIEYRKEKRPKQYWKPKSDRRRR